MYNIWITVKKAALGFITGLAAVILMAIAQAVTNYQPGPEVPAFVGKLWLGAIPLITGALVAAANWLKNRQIK